MFFKANEVERVGNQPNVIFGSMDWYDKSDIESWKEQNVSELKERSDKKNVYFVCLKNLEDPSKCKVIFEGSGSNKENKMAAEEENEVFLYIGK